MTNHSSPLRRICASYSVDFQHKDGMSRAYWRQSASHPIDSKYSPTSTLVGTAASIGLRLRRVKAIRGSYWKYPRSTRLTGNVGSVEGRLTMTRISVGGATICALYQVNWRGPLPFHGCSKVDRNSMISDIVLLVEPVLHRKCEDLDSNWKGEHLPLCWKFPHVLLGA